MWVDVCGPSEAILEALTISLNLSFSLAAEVELEFTGSIFGNRMSFNDGPFSNDIPELTSKRHS